MNIIYFLVVALWVAQFILSELFVACKVHIYNLIVLLVTLFMIFSGCQFPPEWEGIWFQSTVRPYITIDATSISSKGQCTKTDFRGEKYLIKV